MKGVKYMAASAFVMTTMQTLVKSVGHIPAVEVVFFRALISLVLSYITLKQLKISPWGKKENRGLLLLRGVFGTIALVMVFATFQNMPLATALTLHHLAPLFTAILAVIFLKERLFPLQIIFFLVSLAGIVMIKGFDPRVETYYLILAIAGAILAAAAYTVIRKLSGKAHPVVVVFFFPLVAMPLTGIISYFYWVMPQGIDWLYLLGIGVLTQIGQVLLTKAYQAEEAAKVASVNYTSIIYGLLYGYFLFGEIFNIWTYAGMALVLLGVLLNVTFKNSSRFKLGK